MFFLANAKTESCTIAAMTFSLSKIYVLFTIASQIPFTGELFPQNFSTILQTFQNKKKRKTVDIQIRIVKIMTDLFNNISGLIRTGIQRNKYIFLTPP